VSLRSGQQGGAKKVFVPNIPARREKGATEQRDVSPNVPAVQRGRGRGRGEGRGRGRGRGRGELIQTGGSIFGEGVSQELSKKDHFRGERGEGSDSKYVPPPKLNLEKMSTKVDKEEEERRLNELLRDDFIEEMGSRKMGGDLQPILLPLCEVGHAGVKREVKAENKADIKMEVDEQKVKVKSEPMEVDDDCDCVQIKREKIEPSDGEIGAQVKHEDDKKSLEAERLQPLTAAEIITQGDRRASGEFLFFQLPDSLPGMPNVAEQEKRAVVRQDQAGEGTSSQTVLVAEDKAADVKKEDENLYRLSSFKEGCIGKLQVLKSGRTRLVLGNVQFNVEVGTQVGFLQNLATMSLAPKSGEVALLGQVRHRLVCVPDVEALYNC